MSDAATQLYYLNYLYGYFSSGIVYAALHRLFPARAIDDFVRQPMSADDLQKYYRDLWDSDPSESGGLGQNLPRCIQTEKAKAKERVPTAASSMA